MREPRVIKIRLSETKRVLAGHWKAGYNLERLWGYKEALEWVLEDKKGKFKGCKKRGRRSGSITAGAPPGPNARRNATGAGPLFFQDFWQGGPLMAIEKAKRNGNPNEPKPKINRNVVCAGCGKPIRKGEPFYKYLSMMGKPTIYLHTDEECWKLHYGRWRGIKRGRRSG